MAEPQEIERLRDNWYELRKSMDATGITVAVMQERQKAHSEQMDRIEASVLTCSDLLRLQNGRLGTTETRISVIETRQADAASSGAKWGGWIGGIVAAIVGGLVALLGGAK